MFNKFIASAAMAASMLLMTSGAHATAYTTTCAINNTTCQNTFKALGNNSATGASADQVNWGLFANALNTQQNNGAIANSASTTTPNNDQITVSNNANQAFTTYVEGLGTAPTGTVGTRGYVPGTAWDGLFTNGVTVLWTSGNTITLSFATPLIGLGLDAQIFNSGAYTEVLTAYNSSGQQLTTVSNTIASASQSATSNAANNGDKSKEGTAPFVGIATDAQNSAASLAANGISYVTISANCTSNSCTSGGFAIDTSLLYHYTIAAPTGPGTKTPEPGTMSLLGAGLAGLGYFRRRRANKAA